MNATTDQDELPGLGILDVLLKDADKIYDQARAVAEEGGRRVAGVVLMFSGGNDSSTVAHLFRHRVDAAAHTNTGIGIEETRQYVRDTCASWGLPLIEKYVPVGRTFRDLVLGQAIAHSGPNAGKQPIYHGGFPRSTDHQMIFNVIKGRSMAAVRRDFVTDHRTERVIFIGGIRRGESQRRKNRKAVYREGSIVWCNPILNWSKLDLNEYRRRNPDMPRNEVADKLHMSGECLCGSYAHSGELEEIGFWYPDFVAYIKALEAEVKAAGYPNWQWGGGKGTPCEGVCNL